MIEAVGFPVVIDSPPLNRAIREPLSLLAWAAAAMVVLVILAGCSQGGETMTTLDGRELTRQELFEELDQDGDGVIARSDLPFDLLAAPTDAVLVLGDRWSITVADVRQSLEEAPPSQLVPGESPELAIVVSRLTSMARLRMTAVALTDLGFAVSLDQTDEEIGLTASALIEGEFEEFAAARILEERPEIVKISSPHCLSILGLPTEDALAAAVSRVEAGETVSAVAAEVNVEGTTSDPGGALGCNTVLDWNSLLGELARELGELEVGGFTEARSVAYDASDTGMLWFAFHLDEVQFDQSDPASLGPFASNILTPALQAFEVHVDPVLGRWNSESVSIILP